MVSLINLPSYQAPNALNFSGINQAIDSTRQNALMQDQMGMQRERLGMDKEQHAQKQQMMTAQRVGGLAQMGMTEKDPVRRQAILDRIISMHPDKTKLGPEYLSAETAFPMLVQEAQGFVGQEDKAKLGLIGAQTTLAQAQAEKARRDAANGGELPMSVKEWNYYSSLPPEKQQQYLTMKRAQRYYDTGTEFVSPNSVAPGGPPVATIRKDPAGKAEQTKLGEYAAGAPQRTEGKTRLDTLLGGLATDYMTLDKTGGIVNPDKGTMDNVVARARSSGIGQTVSGAMGSKEQSIRQQINNSRPLLIQGIMQATGMSARSLDSNKELEFYLQAVSNPQSDLHSNLVAIDAIDRAYGLGGVLKRTLPKDVYERVSRDSELALARRPLARPPQAAAPGQPPQTTGNSPVVTGPIVPREFGDRLPQPGPAAPPQRLRYNPATGELE